MDPGSLVPTLTMTSLSYLLGVDPGSRHGLIQQQPRPEVHKTLALTRSSLLPLTLTCVNNTSYDQRQSRMRDIPEEEAVRPWEALGPSPDPTLVNSSP